MPFSLKSILHTALAAAVLLLHACTHKTEQKKAGEPQVLHIPVSVNDSLVLSIDKSPMDMSYFPEEYPKQKMVTPDMPEPVARVIYSRPQKNGRIIFADSTVSQNVIQYYGHEWRLGANEATEIEFFKEVTINSKKVLPGRYIIYCIPFADKWQIILNKNLFSWGLHIDKQKDEIETTVKVEKNNVELEYFTMIFQQASYGCNLVMGWGDIKAVLPIAFH